MFAGEQFDWGVGEYYLRQRYYSADTGRFTRRDTYQGKIDEPIALHKYLYAHDDPINSVDPTGLFKLELRYRGFHADIFVTDKKGSRAYWAAAQKQNVGNYVFGIPNNSSSSDSSSGGFGFIMFNETDSQREPEYFEFGTRQTLLDNQNPDDEFPAAIEENIENYLKTLEKSRIPYNFFKRNSNSAAFQALEVTLGYRPSPVVGFLPAWDRNPYTGLTNGDIALTDRVLIGLTVSTTLAATSLTSIWLLSLYAGRFI